jgi:hypothetical protein
MWFNVEHYHNTHSTQYRCTHYTLLSTAWCFQSVCNRVTPWCVILFSTNSSPLAHTPVHFPRPPNRTRAATTRRDFLVKCGLVQSSFHEKVPAWLLWWGSEGHFTSGWTKGLLLVENSMTHQGVTLLHTDWKHLQLRVACSECTFTVCCGCCDNVLHWITLNSSEHLKAYCVLFVQWLWNKCFQDG